MDASKNANVCRSLGEPARDEDAMDELGEGAPVEPAMVSEIREGRLGRC